MLIGPDSEVGLRFESVFSVGNSLKLIIIGTTFFFDIENHYEEDSVIEA
jgi:hypothetical protein